MLLVIVGGGWCQSPQVLQVEQRWMSSAQVPEAAAADAPAKTEEF
jgi:hypothetical protein